MHPVGRTSEIRSELALAKRLQKVRRDQGFTQQALCQAANISYSTLAKIERGAIKSPSIFTVQSIAEALGVSLDYIMGIGETKTPGKLRKTKSGVSFVYFDVNDTLIRAAQMGFTRLAELSGTPPDVIESVFWHYNEALNHGQMSISDFDKVLSKRLGITVDWRQIYLDAAEPIEGMNELVNWTAGLYQVGLMSNTLPGMIAGLQARGLLPEVPYVAIIDSSEIGASKPESKAYQVAQQRAGAAAEEILLIDDSRPNLVAAEQHGWHTSWFDGYAPAESIERLRLALAPAG